MTLTENRLDHVRFGIWYNKISGKDWFIRPSTSTSAIYKRCHEGCLVSWRREKNEEEFVGKSADGRFAWNSLAVKFFSLVVEGVSSCGHEENHDSSLNGSFFDKGCILLTRNVSRETTVCMTGMHTTNTNPHKKVKNMRPPKNTQCLICSWICGDTKTVVSLS